MKNDLAVLNVIAANKWKRPIYFTSQFNELGFGQYLRADGLSYRLVPVQPKENDNVNDEVAYDNMMKKFAFGNADVKGVYFDEENRRHLLTIRQAYASAASSLADDGKKDKAKQLLEKCDKGMDPSNMPYAMVSRFNQHNVVGVSMMDAAYKADYKELADKIERALKRDIEQQLSYYASLGNMSVQELLQHMQNPDGLASKQRTLYSEIDQTFRLQNYLNYVEGKYKAPAVNPETPAVIKTDSPGAKTDSSKK